MFKKQRFAFLAIGGLGLLAAIAPGLAATLNVPDAGSVPAAGQGVVAVQGFNVTNIDWTVDDGTANVVEVRFDIARSADGAADVEANSTARNAQVRVRLLDDAANKTGAAWVDCVVIDGEAACDTSAVGDTMAAADLESVDIIAFDTTEPPSS